MRTIKVREVRDEKDLFCGDRGDTYYYALANDYDEGFIVGCDNPDIDFLEGKLYSFETISNDTSKEGIFSAEVTHGELLQSQLKRDFNIGAFDGLFLVL